MNIKQFTLTQVQKLFLDESVRNNRSKIKKILFNAASSNLNDIVRNILEGNYIVLTSQEKISLVNIVMSNNEIDNKLFNYFINLIDDQRKRVSIINQFYFQLTLSNNITAIKNLSNDFIIEKQIKLKALELLFDTISSSDYQIYGAQFGRSYDIEKYKSMIKFILDDIGSDDRCQKYYYEINLAA